MVAREVFRAALIALLVPWMFASDAGAQEAAASPGAGGASATESQRPRLAFPILVFDRARVLSQSEMGKALEARLDKARADLLSENEKMYADLEAEERAIAEEKSQMSEADFRARSSAFDDRVTELRDEQDQKAQDVQALYDQGLADLETAMNEVLAAAAHDLGAVVVLERQQVYLMSGAIDVSQIVIDGLDKKFTATQEDAGADSPEAPPESPAEE